MKHYVYKITFPTNHIYVGVRSCNCPVEEDIYMGSPRTHKHYWDEYEPVKTIIADDFDTREEANEFEAFCIEMQWLKNKGLSLNACVGGNKFHCLGVKRSEETKAKISENRSETYQFLDENNKVVNITNLCGYSKDRGLSQTSLWMLATGVKKSYKGLKCLPEVYEAKQKEISEELEQRKKDEQLYPNMCFSKHLGKVKYRVYKNSDSLRFNRMYLDRLEALEVGLILNQIWGD